MKTENEAEIGMETESETESGTGRPIMAGGDILATGVTRRGTELHRTQIRIMLGRMGKARGARDRGGRQLMCTHTHTHGPPMQVNMTMMTIDTDTGTTKEGTARPSRTPRRGRLTSEAKMSFHTRGQRIDTTT